MSEFAVKSHPPKPIASEKIDRIVAMLHAGRSYEEVIRTMRQLEFGKIDCIKLLRDQSHMSLYEAKALVHLSPAWEDRFDSDERLHNVAEEALRIDTEQAAAHL